MANLTFLKSLGDSWRIFQLAKGSQIKTMSTLMLYAEIRAYDATNAKLRSETTLYNQARALIFNIHCQPGGSIRGNHCKVGGNGGRNYGSNSGGNRGGKKGGNSRVSKKGGFKRNSDFDPNKYCTVHGRQGVNSCIVHSGVTILYALHVQASL